MEWYNLLSLRSLVLLLALFKPGTCAFSLDTVVQDYWYYVHNHLAATTSAACLAAYSAPIDCDITLLGLVSSGSPNFNPGPADFERLCVPSCLDSLNAYVQNLKDVCTLEGDGALVETNTRPRPQVPVATVGEIFQYEYAFSCSKNSSGWCALNYPLSREWARADFTCTNECAVQFFTTAHDFPGSNYAFLIYDLNDRSDWWKNQWALGWKHVLECKSIATASTRSYLSTTTTSTITSTTSTTSTTSRSSSRASTKTSSSSTTTPASTSATVHLPASTSSSGARQLRAPFAHIMAWRF